jgi:hypothetical protein
MVENCVAARDDEADGGHLRMARGEVRFEKYGMDVPFEVIHGDERFVERQGKNFAVGHADKQRAGEAGALGDGDGVEVSERDFSLIESFAYDRDDFRRCSREASSGTTPPYLRWMSICEETMLERMRRPSATTAAAVSSQEDSMPRISFSGAAIVILSTEAID